jgi:hypothetical protein
MASSHYRPAYRLCVSLLVRRGKTAKASGVTPTATANGPVIGNRNGKIYHIPYFI